MTGRPEAQDQSEVIDFLSRADSYGTGVDSVKRIDTHGAVVFLAGERAYKLKRAVRFPYMDYSTPEKRRAMCEAELAINRRTAPTLYEAVMPVTREAGALRIGGTGVAVDWLVVMRRFDEAGLFDHLAARGALTDALMRELAVEIAEFHAAAERRPDHGGAAGIEWVIDGNRTGLLDAGEMFARDKVERFDHECRGALERSRALLDARRAAGFVRRCHGDLHLRNICLIDGHPVLFDAIEFSDRIACIDTLYDLAFLLMDLEQRGLRPLGNAAFNAYLQASGDRGALAALPLFLACRAGVKAQTLAASARAQPVEAARNTLAGQARAALDLGLGFLSPAPARLVAIGGLSGTGKSTVARLVAPALGRAPGAVVLRSDVIRKTLAGVSPTTRLDAGAYTREASRRVYHTLIDSAREVAATGQAAIADAVFAAPEERDAIAAAARAAGVAFTGIWLEAPPERLAERIDARRDDASDATVEVLRRQLAYDLGAIEWHRVDASGRPEDIAAAITSFVSACPDTGNRC